MLKVACHPVGFDYLLAPRAPADLQTAPEILPKGLATEEAVEEDCKGGDLGVRLVSDRDVRVDEIEHVPRDLLGAHDDQEVAGRETRQDVLHGLPVHREMDLRPAPLLQHASPRDPGLDQERPAEPTDHVADRAFESRISRRDEDRVRAERASSEGDVGRDAFVAGRAVAETEDRDHVSVLESDDPVAPEIEAGGSLDQRLQLRLGHLERVRDVAGELAFRTDHVVDLLFDL
jgi:hypothetical protein